jgi:hypothetical protein
MQMIHKIVKKSNDKYLMEECHASSSRPHQQQHKQHHQQKLNFITRKHKKKFVEINELRQLVAQSNADRIKPKQSVTLIESDRKRNSSAASHMNNLNMKNLNIMKKKKTKLLFLIATVAITFATTWLPAHVINIWKTCWNDSFPYNDTMYIIKLVSHTLTYTNSVLNPIIYVFIGARFRSHIYSEFNTLFKACFCSSFKKN